MGYWSGEIAPVGYWVLGDNNSHERPTNQNLPSWIFIKTSKLNWKLSKCTMIMGTYNINNIWPDTSYNIKKSFLQASITLNVKSFFNNDLQ